MTKTKATNYIIVTATLTLFTLLFIGVWWVILLAIQNHSTPQPFTANGCYTSFISENGFTVTDIFCYNDKNEKRREILIRYNEETEE